MNLARYLAVMRNLHSTCNDPSPTVPAPEPTRWDRFEFAAVAVLASLRLLRAWYFVARLALRACPPLARAVVPLSRSVLVPSISGGGIGLPVKGGGHVGRPMAFGGDIHDGDECDLRNPGGELLPAPHAVARFRRTRHWSGRAIVDAQVGWMLRRGGRT